jgi:hypothetical protein
VVGTGRLLVEHHGEPVEHPDRDERSPRHPSGQLRVDGVRRHVRGQQGAQSGVGQHQLVGAGRPAVLVGHGQRAEPVGRLAHPFDHGQHGLGERQGVEPGHRVVQRAFDGLRQRRMPQQRGRLGGDGPEAHQQRMAQRGHVQARQAQLGERADHRGVRLVGGQQHGRRSGRDPVRGQRHG